MVPLEAPYSAVYIDTFIFFLRSLCKIIWMNVHYFPNAPRTIEMLILLLTLFLAEYCYLQSNTFCSHWHSSLMPKTPLYYTERKK